MTIGHLDESGGPCAHHAAVSDDLLLALAMIGARASTFHHDIASKLQGLMMAIDEMTELVEIRPDEDMKRATETAHSALNELNQLLVANRTLTKPPVRSDAKFGELLGRAGERVGVQLRGSRVDAPINVAIPAFTHGLALAIDAAAGVGRNRAMPIECAVAAGHVEVVLAIAAPAAANVSELLAIASWLVGRDDGELRCRGSSLVIRVPTV